MSTTALSRNSTNVRYAMALAWHRARLSIASRVAPRRAMQAAADLFATPPRITHTAREVEFLSNARAFTVPSSDGDLAAWRIGGEDRPAVVLSHGWGGRGAQMRAFAQPLREAGYQVVLFDHPGHGHSARGQSSLIQFVHALDAVIAEVESRGAPLAGLVGHSLGAAAVAAWLNRTGRASRAVLVAPPTSIRRYSKHFARRLGITEPVRQAMQEHFEHRLGRRWEEFELPQAVANVRAEALVIHDEHDADVPMGAGVALARHWRGARFLATRGLGHRGVLRDPAVVRDAVDFLAGRVVFAPPPVPGARSPFASPAPLL